MGVFSQIEGAGCALGCAVFAHRLRDRHDMVLIEASLEGRPAMPRGPE